MDELWIMEGHHRRAAEQAICEYCGKEFLRRISPSKGSQKKRFCNLVCRHARTTRIQVTCSHCGKQFLRAKSKTKKHKNFCSRDCRDAFARKPMNKCLLCGKTAKVKYCSRKCQLEYQHKEYVSRWLEGKISGNRDGGEISTHIRDYLIEKAGYKCSKCRWSQTNPVTKTVPLQINHIDGDSKNSRPSNLEVVCPNCHSLTPTYGSLNLGKWREKRRKRYGELTVPANGTGLNPVGS